MTTEAKRMAQLIKLAVTNNQMTVPNSLVTRRIAGHEFSLEAGTRYIASRPIADQTRTVYPVTIQRVSPEPVDPDTVVDGLKYSEADALVNAFNNGRSSFEGRIW